MEQLPISRLLEEKTNRLIEQAETTGRVNASELQELRRLIAVADIAKSRKPTKRVSHVPLILLGLLTMVVASVLIFRRISAADIALDADVSQLTFVIAGSNGLTLLNAAWPLSSLGIEQASQLTLPTGDKTHPNLELTGSSAFGRLTASGAPQPSGRIVLSSLGLEPNTRVDLSQRDGVDEYELRLTPPANKSISIKAVLDGNVETQYPEVDTKMVAFSREILTASADGQALVMSIRPASSSIEFVRNIPVTELRLFQVEEYLNPEQTVLREVSSIQQGTLFQDSLKGEELKLRVGEDLHLEGLSGTLRQAGVKGSLISLRFSGAVTDMEIGHGAAGRSLMPTTLEWLASRQGLSLFWGTIVYVIGFIAALWNWVWKEE